MAEPCKFSSAIPSILRREYKHAGQAVRRTHMRITFSIDESDAEAKQKSLAVPSRRHRQAELNCTPSTISRRQNARIQYGCTHAWRRLLDVRSRNLQGAGVLVRRGEARSGFLAFFIAPYQSCPIQNQLDPDRHRLDVSSQ